MSDPKYWPMPFAPNLALLRPNRHRDRLGGISTREISTSARPLMIESGYQQRERVRESLLTSARRAGLQPSLYAVTAPTGSRTIGVTVDMQMSDWGTGSALAPIMTRPHPWASGNLCNQHPQRPRTAQLRQSPGQPVDDNSCDGKNVSSAASD